jgi:hypothetical protein
MRLRDHPDDADDRALLAGDLSSSPSLGSGNTVNVIHQG